MSEVKSVVTYKHSTLIRFALFVFIIVFTYIAYKALQLDELSSLENIGAFINDARDYSHAQNI